MGYMEKFFCRKKRGSKEERGNYPTTHKWTILEANNSDLLRVKEIY